MKTSMIFVLCSAFLTLCVWFFFNRSTSDMANDVAGESDEQTPAQTRTAQVSGEHADKSSERPAEVSEKNRFKQLAMKDFSVGSKKMATDGSRVTYHVIIKLTDGRVVFDSLKSGTPWTGTVGDGSLLNGLDRGIRGMYQGGRRAIWIPALFAYGKNGLQGQVPPDSDIYAEIELLSVF